MINSTISKTLTIKELTDAVGGGITPRMVRHYHQLGLLPQPKRSSSNYRLYTDKDIIRLQRIVALKQQGFQLNHIRQILEVEPETDATASFMAQLQQQYQSVMQQISQLRQTASALEGLLGRDRNCQIMQAEVLAQLKLLEVETKTGLSGLEKLWRGLDAQVHAHPEAFQESLQHLLPDLSNRSEIEQDLISQLVLACGDISLASFVRLNQQAIASSREALKSGCEIVVDIPTVAAALDMTRLAHLNCHVEILIDNPHITSATEAEKEFWQHQEWQEKLLQVSDGCIIVVGYAPSVLLSVCEAIQKQKIHPTLVIGMPIGFSHAPAAKRQLMQLSVGAIAIEGTLGGGLLAATALNALVESLIEKPDCHCYLSC
ncbi:MerR family transcriptional regulator [Scytonema hofmannii PCC 7110]|uniref:MerR family transcriptional regulator n=1 Tax=Scytonema hofmannii PCC 7110 TaxID=128403 RepID=A0A139XEB1_9CYAN|nr:precorrin-8X methylmutase [Scytonema hofmannii]KYC43041.1 MerR family transcriptional regulator [Scytonema hofmannii PCC 7110]